MKINKIFGWFLLAIGLIIIFGSLYFSFNIFTNRNEAPEIFKLEKVDKEIDNADLMALSPEAMQEIIQEQVKNMMPSEFMSKLLNLISWSIFAGILIFAGSRVSGIGIRLMREGL